MAQNIYDKADFFEGYSRLHRSVEGLDGAPEWPVLRAMLPKVGGLSIVDLGCGFGWFCRWAGAHGAKQVLGLDLSERMLARARAAGSDEAIAYERVDLDELSLPKARFDLAYSSLALHYVSDAARLFATVYQALVPGGFLRLLDGASDLHGSKQSGLVRGRRRKERLARRSVSGGRAAHDRLVLRGRGEAPPHTRHHAQQPDPGRVHHRPRGGILSN
ncbi:class I SAM-dependent methyltransferase [Mesorhizobium sp. AA23]|uniref:class I SAM-dependent methyltransferase n=1 Tax=Mesorhizobium sp. AA23 TaxID=1854058 RepID=UPI000B2EB5F2|nr:class I SAM-dependent methyltransferase [Mesorhizobium sp. AA23]